MIGGKITYHPSPDPGRGFIDPGEEVDGIVSPPVNKT
jgi:hypothetical protein